MEDRGKDSPHFEDPTFYLMEWTFINVITVPMYLMMSMGLMMNGRSDTGPIASMLSFFTVRASSPAH